jgi:membrane associated rhomboid family serine protease
MVAAGLLTMGCWGFFGYLARLGERIPDATLTTRSRSVRKGLVICFGGYLTITLLNQLLLWIIVLGGSRSPRAVVSTGVPGCVGLLILLALLVYLNRALQLLTAFRKHLRRVQNEALRNWNNATAPPPPVAPAADT